MDKKQDKYRLAHGAGTLFYFKRQDQTFTIPILYLSENALPNSWRSDVYIGDYVALDDWKYELYGQDQFYLWGLIRSLVADRDIWGWGW
jgi:hypothetical protein